MNRIIKYSDPSLPVTISQFKIFETFPYKLDKKEPAPHGEGIEEMEKALHDL